jgi:Ca-activated chloride channel family protein
MIARPLVLLLLVVVVGLIAAYALVQRRRGRFALQFSDASLFDSVAPRRPGWRRHVVAACFLTVVTLLVVSVAGPVRSRDVLRERAIVILTVDTSLSMGAVDVDPTRIEAAQEAARQFLEGAPAGVDVGLVSFDEAPIVEVPPTPDRLTVVDAIDALELGPYTNTGDAISVSISTLERTIEQLQVSDESAPPAVVVLLSDGEPTIGRPIEDAIAEAKQAGIPVSTVSLGTPMGRVTIEDPDRPGTFFDGWQLFRHCLGRGTRCGLPRHRDRSWLRNRRRGHQRVVHHSCAGARPRDRCAQPAMVPTASVTITRSVRDQGVSRSRSGRGCDGRCHRPNMRCSHYFSEPTTHIA